MSTTKGTSPNATSNYTTCKLWQIICYSMVPAVGNFFMIVFTMNAYIAKGGYGLATALAASIASSSCSMQSQIRCVQFLFPKCGQRDSALPGRF